MIETDEKLKKTFKNFVAKFKRFEDWVFIEWCNEKEGELHISGDLGSGVFESRYLLNNRLLKIK